MHHYIAVSLGKARNICQYLPTIHFICQFILAAYLIRLNVLAHAWVTATDRFQCTTDSHSHAYKSKKFNVMKCSHCIYIVARTSSQQKLINTKPIYSIVDDNAIFTHNFFTAWALCICFSFKGYILIDKWVLSSLVTCEAIRWKALC